MPRNRLWIWPSNFASASARRLARTMGALRILPNGRYSPRPSDIVINWGNASYPEWNTSRPTLFNLPGFVVRAVDKRRALQILSENGVKVPDFCFEKDAAVEMLKSPLSARHVNAVMCRTLTRASEGRGIVVAKSPEELVDAPLYTRYVPKKSEFRVHVFGSRVIDAVQKKKRVGAVVNSYVRNHSNGYVFCRQNIQVPNDVFMASIKSIEALRLHFGAVDVGWHPDFGTCVYEVNTAPGLEGSTVAYYAREFLRKCV